MVCLRSLLHSNTHPSATPPAATAGGGGAGRGFVAGTTPAGSGGGGAGSEWRGGATLGGNQRGPWSSMEGGAGSTQVAAVAAHLQIFVP
eukprot:2853133-Rhodomonas_salina.1